MTTSSTFSADTTKQGPHYTVLLISTKINIFIRFFLSLNMCYGRVELSFVKKKSGNKYYKSSYFKRPRSLGFTNVFSRSNKDNISAMQF